MCVYRSQECKRIKIECNEGGDPYLVFHHITLHYNLWLRLHFSRASCAGPTRAVIFQNERVNLLFLIFCLHSHQINNITYKIILILQHKNNNNNLLSIRTHI